MIAWSQSSKTIGKYTIKIGGEEIDNWTSFSSEDTLDLNVNQASITFPDFKPLEKISFVNQDVQILRDGIACWRGLGTKYENVLNASNMRDWNLSCLSNKVYLNREAFRKSGSLSYTYGGWSCSFGGGTLSNPIGAIFPPAGAPVTQYTRALDIFNDILNCQYTAKLTLGNTNTSNSPHTILQFARQNALYALNQLLAGSLCEARFNPDNTVDFQSIVGSQSPVYSFIEGRDILDFRYQYGIDKFVNDPIVAGQGSNSSQIYEEPTNNASSLATYGRWSKIYNFGNINDKNTLLAYANALQVDLQQPIYTIDLLVTLPVAGVPFKVGDVINVTSDTLDLSLTQYRVIAIKRQYDASSGEQITITVQPNARLVSLSHARLKSLEFILNNQMNAQQGLNNTINPSASSYSTGLSIGYYNPTLPTNCYYYGTSFDLIFQFVNSFSGYFAGATLNTYVWWSSSPGTVNLQIYDASTSPHYVFVSKNISSGDEETVAIPNTQDIIDHIIVFYVNWPNSGQQVNAQFQATFNAPTIPT